MTDLTSRRCIYSRLSTEHFALYSRLVMNEAVMKYITGKALNEEEAEIRFYKAVDATIKNPGAGFFIVRSKQAEKLIGVAKLVETDTNQAELGYMILPEYWGNGYASEMVEFMIRLTRELKLADELIGIVDPGNPASIGVLSKFGFKLSETGELEGLASSIYKLELTN
jgi:[ribosomal protein S5]-alanine N-acetyltransferase